MCYGTPAPPNETKVVTTHEQAGPLAIFAPQSGVLIEVQPRLKTMDCARNIAI